MQDTLRVLPHPSDAILVALHTRTKTIPCARRTTAHVGRCRIPRVGASDEQHHEQHSSVRPQGLYRNVYPTVHRTLVKEIDGKASEKWRRGGSWYLTRGATIIAASAVISLPLVLCFEHQIPGPGAASGGEGCGGGFRRHHAGSQEAHSDARMHPAEPCTVPRRESIENFPGKR